MTLLIIGIILLSLFILSVHHDARKFINVFLLLGAILFIFFGIAELTQNIDFIQTALLAFAYVLVPFIMLVIIVLLIIDGVVMIKKEGKRPKNFLPFLIALAFICSIVFLIVIGSMGKMNIYLLDLIWLDAILCIYFCCTFGALFLYSLVYSFIPKRLDCDYIIVHGCGLSGGERITPLLRGRVDKAVKVYNKTKEKMEKNIDNENNKEVKIVLSGGQGPDEKISEAQAMQNYLKEIGFPIEHTILEDKSTTTYENLKNIRDMLDSAEEKKKYVFVTNNYHVFRTSIFARKLGINADGVGCKTALYYWPSAFIREYVAIMMRYKWITVAVIVLWAIAAAVSTF